MFKGDAANNSGMILRGDKVNPDANKRSDIKEDAPKVKVYRDFHNIQMGMIGKKPDTWTFYDMLFDRGREADFIRSSFHDWAIPVVQEAYMSESVHLTNINSVQRLQRGVVTTSAFHVDEYIYVALNGALKLKSDVGSSYGTAVDRTTILACVFCGDPRRMNNLDNARIMYVLPMNSPWRSWCTTAARVMTTDGSIDTLYDINGDLGMAAELHKMWFGKDYYFNRVVYPVASGAEANPYV